MWPSPPTLWSAVSTLILLPVQNVAGYDLDPTDKTSVSAIAQKVAFKMMEFYPGNKTGGIPGLFGDPYYWWEAGAVFGGLIDYWYYTGDAGYNNVTSEALLWQVGTDNNFMPLNETQSLVCCSQFQKSFS